ncbi:hypothetical protein SteCoe_2717 [Stentor coeruleus]|uniref:non-specific serine/threonine protein kinase n=1 Tax=Stentor coeruleus TaxID=5963 RepID=A0A1R2CZ00_9CILI|nr:hypothetical protein SteCoe_2717 [Stentor coeruleus]
MGNCTSKMPKDSDFKNCKRENLKLSFSNFIKHKNVSNDYVIENLIAEGPHGTVHESYHVKTLRKVAIKTISLKHSCSNSLLREANILQELDHPNIIKVIDAYTDEKNLYIVTELCKGGELFKRILKEGSISENQAAEYMQQIVSAISYLHKHSIVHRDLRAENLIFKTEELDSYLKLIDFGVSKHFNQKVKASDRFGSIYYIAPEAVHGSINEKCDVWSMGIILHLLLSGTVPFNGINEEEININIKNSKLNLQSKHWNKISSEAKDLLVKMLKKNPSERLTVEEIFRHPWIQQRTLELVEDNLISKSSLKKLAKFYELSLSNRPSLNYAQKDEKLSDQKEKLS